jgi:hypothetical protein
MLPLERPYPDEPITGALVRGCRHFGVALKQVLHPGEHGTGKANGMPLFGVSPLPFFADLFRANPRMLLAGHTVLPYATAFSEHDVWERSVTAALAGTSSNRAMGAVIQSAIQGIPFRRTCSACIAEDLSTRGESYWRLSHQLPGSLVCHVHGQVLLATGLRVAGSGTSYDLPQDCKGRRCVVGPVRSIWQRVAVRTAELSGRGLEPPLARDDSHYKERAIARGWLRPGRAVNAQRLTELFIETFGKAELLACGLVRSDQVNWSTLMLHARPGIPFVTLKHVLMEIFLEGEPVDLSHKPSGPGARSRVDEDKALAVAFTRVASAYAARSQRAKVSSLLQEAGCLGPYRHSKDRLPRLRRAVENFQSSQHAHRPQALQLFVVPGSDGDVSTRKDLIEAGHLISSEAAAARLGIHWYQMKALQRSGHILTIRYAARDWYPAFWFDGRVDSSKLEAALQEVADQPLPQQWSTMAALWASADQRLSSSDSFRQALVN